jgi:hypothetical protein
MSYLVFSDHVMCSHPLFQKTIFCDQQIGRQTTIHALRLTASPTASSLTTRIAWQSCWPSRELLPPKSTYLSSTSPCLHALLGSFLCEREREIDREKRERLSSSRPNSWHYAESTRPPSSP